MTRAQTWAREVLASHPHITTVRLGLAYDELTGDVSVWIDLIHHDGWHEAANSTALLLAIPLDVQTDVRASLHTGGSVDFTRDQPRTKESGT